MAERAVPPKLTPPVTFSTDPSISSDDLRRQSKTAKKGLAHSPWIKESGLTRYEIGGVATLFHHQSGGFRDEDSLPLWQGTGLFRRERHG